MASMEYQRWIKQAMKYAERAGWIVTTNGHIKFTSPTGTVVVCCSTPRNNTFAVTVAKRRFKHAGLELA